MDPSPYFVDRGNLGTTSIRGLDRFQKLCTYRMPIPSIRINVLTLDIPTLGFTIPGTQGAYFLSPLSLSAKLYVLFFFLRMLRIVWSPKVILLGQKNCLRMKDSDNPRI